MRTIDNIIAQVMWEADDRPCRWTDLDASEMAEWERMAKAARNWMKAHYAAAVQSESPVIGQDITAALSLIVKNLAVASIRGTE